ncbi:MAG: hypothetical protein ABR567_03460 [Myxococcales bacterium]|nr:hypothetical protein [Myxococcales bacterium]
MTSSLVRRALLAAIIAAVSISGCKCGAKVTGAGCQSDEECRADLNGSDRAFCDRSKTPAVCELHPKQCDTAADCCPAQVCNAQGHYCFDKYTPCTQDGSCPAQGEACKEIGVFAKGLGCTFEKCGPTGACGEGTTCFNKYCVGEPPCNGGCKNAASPVCVTATNLCSPAPKGAGGAIDASCAQTCPGGKILVLQDPDNIFDTCNLGAEKCECDSLPPLQTCDVSRHSSMAVSGQNVYVSAYDGDPMPGSTEPYGDLVVHTFDKSDLTKPQKTEWLDGVPATGHIGGDVNGPRGGITDRGPNVGQYSSIAANALGDLYVAYYDADNGDLKFTARYGGPAARWITPITIDGSTPIGSAPSNGDVGMYASLALDKTGVPAIAYFRRGDYDAASATETGLSTALVYAVAKRPQPLTRDDWVVVGDVDRANRPPPPCNNLCTNTQICVADPNAAGGQRCAEKSTAQCNATQTPAGCTGNQVCVQDTDTNHSPVCRSTEAAATLAELPAGTGLMPSLGFVDNADCLDQSQGCAVIAYYDSLKGAVKAVQAAHAGASPAFGPIKEIDGDDPPPAQSTTPPVRRDTGRWPALAIGPAGQAGGRIAIAFADLTNQQLLVYQSDALFEHSAHVNKPGDPGLIHVVDSGRPGAGEPWHPQSFPGAQTSIAFTPSGKLALAYQDATPTDLVFAIYDPSASPVPKATSRTTMRSTGAAGFWPKIAVSAGTAYVSSATIKAVNSSRMCNPLSIDAKSAP